MKELCPIASASEQTRRKDDRVKGDIVFTDKLKKFDGHFGRRFIGFGRKPPAFIVKGFFSRRSEFVCELERYRNIADRRVEPHVKDFVFVAFFRHGYAPFQIARNRTLV